MPLQRKSDLLVAPAGEAALIFVVALAGWAAHQPLIFTSLGPTAYELIETPERGSACTYNIMVGHLTGVAAGFLAVWVTGARWAPQVSAAGVPWVRVWAAVLATALTVVGTLALRASQPAALSTTLLIALGKMQRWQDALVIMAAVVIVTAVGQPIRHVRLRRIKEAKDRESKR